MLSLLLMAMYLKICCCWAGHRSGRSRRVVSAVLLPLVVSPVARVVVGGAAAVPAGVRPRLNVHVHHVRLEGIRAHEALPAVGAPEKCRNWNGANFNIPWGIPLATGPLCSYLLSLQDVGMLERPKSK